MKRMKFFAAVATIVVLCTAFVGCDTASDLGEAPKKEEPTKEDPTPDPSTPETTDWRWSVIGDQTLDFFSDTEIVEAKNIGQLTRLYNGKPETKLDSVILRYQLGIELSAPKRVVVMSQDTTVLGNARKNTTLNSEYVRTAKDSVCTVSTGHTFPTQYYDINATTTSKRGYSLHAGHWEPYKYITESAQWKKIWHEPITEVTMNDSVYNREVVHNELTFVIRSNKGNTWYISREEVVIVDHFVKIREEEKEEKVSADDYLKGLARFVSATKVYNTDTKLWGDAYLFEGAESYRIFVRWYSKDDSSKGSTSVEVPFTTCPQSDKYNAVAYIRGNLYPGKISHTGKVWDIGCAVNGTGEVQGYGELDVDFSGIKNFEGNNTAVPSPYIAATPSERTVNGYKIISVTGKTSVHTSKVTIADASLKK